MPPGMCPPSPCDHLLSISTYLEEYLPSLVSFVHGPSRPPGTLGTGGPDILARCQGDGVRGVRVARGIGGHGVVGVLENGMARW
jgi:hypothetical protein